MALGVIGRKCGMTRIFTEDGLSIPVTVIEAQPNRVTQLKTKATDGYEAGRGFWEFRIENEDLDLQLGNVRRTR